MQQQAAENKARWAHLPGFVKCSRCQSTGTYSRRSKGVMRHSQCTACTGTGYRAH